MISKFKTLLQNYKTIYPEEIISKDKMLDFLNKSSNPFERDFIPQLNLEISLASNFPDNMGHFTASAFLLNVDKTKFLLMHHKKLNKWLQPGGHCDGDNDVLAVAIREAQEESGINEIETVNNEIFDIDVHYIPQNRNEPAHYHYDVRFLLKTTNNDNFIKNTESHELKWFNIPDYPQLDIELERSVTRMVEKFKNITSN